MGILSQLKDTAVSALFPRRCPLCGGILRPNERVCGSCSDELVFIDRPICCLCGRPAYDCACDGSVRYYERSVSPFVYTKSVRSGLHRLKFHNAPSVADFFSRFMAASVRREYSNYHIDIVTSVPMYSADVNRRGYNQAALLATGVGKALNIPVANNIVNKVVATNVQHTLPRAERMKNIHGAFEVIRPYSVRGKVVLLCDDIITTGYTLDECARVIIKSGADCVLCVTAAAVVSSSQQNVKRVYV